MPSEHFLSVQRYHPHATPEGICAYLLASEELCIARQSTLVPNAAVDAAVATYCTAYAALGPQIIPAPTQEHAA